MATSNQLVLDGGSLQGGISYTAPQINFGTQQSINGGFNFDLPLATVAAFTNTALNFSANNSQNALGFLQGVLGTSQANVTRTADRAYEFQTQSLASIQQMQKQGMTAMETMNARNNAGAMDIANTLMAPDMYRARTARMRVAGNKLGGLF